MVITCSRNHRYIGGTIGSVCLYPCQEFHAIFSCADGSIVEVIFNRCNVFFDMIFGGGRQLMKVGERISVCTGRYMFLVQGTLSATITKQPIFIWRESREEMLEVSLREGFFAIVGVQIVGVPSVGQKQLLLR